MLRALAILLIPSAVLAAPPSFVGGAGATVDEAVLVSRAGEIYRRVEGTWRRQPGGVAADLVATWGRTPGELVALGERAPAYRGDGKTWSGLPGALTGPAVLAAGASPRPGLAVGKRLFVLEPGAARWTAAGMAPGRVVALWTASPKDLVVLVDGNVHRLVPGRWQPVKLAEPIVALGGAPPLALGASGGVYVLEKKRTRKLTSPAGFKPRLVLGRVLVADDVLGRIDGVKIAPLGAPPEGGVSVLLELSDGSYLAATRAGRVFTGKPGAWKEEPVDAEPQNPNKPVAPPAQIPTGTSR